MVYDSLISQGLDGSGASPFKGRLPGYGDVPGADPSAGGAMAQAAPVGDSDPSNGYDGPGRIPDATPGSSYGQRLKKSLKSILAMSGQQQGQDPAQQQAQPDQLQNLANTGGAMLGNAIGKMFGAGGGGA